jgi:hypothetical protein
VASSSAANLLRRASWYLGIDWGRRGPPECPSCSGTRTRIVGQSGTPAYVHYRCEDCGEVFSLRLFDR